MTYKFQLVKLTPEQIDFLKNTDFDISAVSADNTVAPELFILAVGLDGFEMGNLKISNDCSDIEIIDKTKKINDQDIAMMTSYIKQQVRDTYGVQLQLAG